MFPSSQQAYQSLQDYSSKRRTTQDIQKEAETKYNIPGITSRLSNLRSLVGNLESSVENVDPSVTARVQGGYGTEAQRQALVNRERAPILGDLSKQQNAMGQAQQEFSLSSALAGDLARSLRSDDEAGYQRLLDQYNAATAQEQAAEAKRQWEAQQAEQRRQFDAQQKASGGYDLSGLLGNIRQASEGGASKTDPLQQVAYNDVFTRVGKQSDQALISDWNATKKSAGYGNPKDKLKMEIYAQLRPDLFAAPTGKAWSGMFKSTPKPAPAPAKSSMNTNLFKGSAAALGLR